MDETLNNQFIDTFEETYLKELNNQYTIFLWVLCHNLFGHLLNLYGKFTTADLEENNHWMNNPIDLSLPTNKYFDQIDDCLQFVAVNKALYMGSQVVQKSHHVVLKYGIYIDDRK